MSKKKKSWIDRLFPRAEPNKLKGVGIAETQRLDDQPRPSPFRYRSQDIERESGQIKTVDLSLEELMKKSSAEQRKVVIEHDPIVSKAASDFVKYVNPGFFFTTDYTSDDPENAPGMEIYREFTEKIDTYYGGWGTVFDSATRSCFQDGAWFFELQIAEDGITPVDWRNLDPMTAVYRYGTNPETGGDFFELGQYKTGSFGKADSWQSFALDPTITYLPLQPNAKNPYGDQLLTSAVTAAAIKLKFARDLSTFLENLAMPSMLASIDRQVLKDSYSGLNDDEIKREVGALIEAINRDIRENKGSKLYVYGNEVQISDLLSGLNGSSLGRIQEVVDLYERDVIRAVQSQPILQGRNESLAGTHATRQQIDYGAGIQHWQTPMSKAITDKWNFILRLNGLPPLAQFKFQFTIAEEFKEKTEISKLVQETLRTGEEVLEKTISNIQTAIEAELITLEEGQELYQEALAKRSQDDLQSQF